METISLDISMGSGPSRHHIQSSNWIKNNALHHSPGPKQTLTCRTLL
jgi:hypothetical protein